MNTDTLSIEGHITALRPKLIAFARLQLRDSVAAEDTVQDTLIVALEKHDAFAGRSAFETWVFGILKNKILERIRYERRYCSWQDSSWQNSEQSDEDAFENLFQDNGRWQPAHKPQSWGNPDQVLENASFWKLLDTCLLVLPDSTARVFTMRELMGLTTQEICDALSLSDANCWVMLHRARLKLRACIEKGWLT
ncbi:sigma-70 family RNA polymerase sigma factor [Halomonas sp. M1]|uniref:sigma-70 family RNA polymerase sigma factor n=1 Tax=Halomonas sp. M1 TaxID=3035470 RepID=UPI00248522D7|nr:sigma-70 family RNA polymerase sigma factor [Halomonas sp. M1]WFE71134.1 sigma-70 family RNA polymerase sigma factor [Halomonas sp. M1]